MKVLITGGSGFIGSHLARKLILDGHSLTVIDDQSSGKGTRKSSVTFFDINVSDERCDAIFEAEKFDVVVHLAFKGYDKETFESKREWTHENVMGLNNILNLSEKYNVKKVVLLSSYKVYGNKGEKAYTEHDILEPADLEGKSYLTRELIAQNYKNLGLNTVILRAGAVYGPGQYGTDMAYVKSETKALGDLIYVEDLVSAVSSAISGNCDSILNIASGEGEKGIMDVTKMKSNLKFYPITKWERGRQLATDRILQEEVLTEEISSKKKNWRINSKYRDLEIVLLFAIIFAVNYYIRFNLGLGVDLFIIFIVYVSLFYGLLQGMAAVFLAIVSFLWFEFNYDNREILKFLYDTSSVMHIMLYFVVGYGAGFYAEQKKSVEKHLTETISFLSNELEFVNDLLGKTVQIKDNLKNKIETYDNNLHSIDSIVQKIRNIPQNQLEIEIPKIIGQQFGSRNVSMYVADEEGSHLYLRAFSGENNLPESLKIEEHDFLKQVKKQNEAYVNKELDSDIPMVSLPMFSKNKFAGALFLDDVSFNSLNQLYLDRLKVIMSLIVFAMFEQ